ncbi:MAG TPA: AraC family transcriptional regulator [Woeseiaceae bacterium]|nr:AraC family transcriptional regulator [Woeseiaceae bacterium]
MPPDARQEGGQDRSRWSLAPRWYLWDGGFLVIGKSEGVVPPHAHHAIQIVIAIEGDVGIKSTTGDWRDGRGVIIRQDAEHSYDGRGANGAMLFVDPESSEGAWLRTALAEAITIVPDKRLEDSIAALRTFCERPFESLEIGELIRHCVVSLCAGAPPARRLDRRVSRVLEAIRASDDLRMSLEDAAAIAFLSPSRFAHLFKQQVGLPYRRYLLWRKVTRAMVAIGKERTIGAAAHASDFADAAHLTRTFYQMFGIPPSVMMRGEFFEIASPFSAAG